MKQGRGATGSNASCRRVGTTVSLLLLPDERFTGLALRLKRIELLLEPFLGGFAGVDRAANSFLAVWAVAASASHCPASALTEAPVRLVRPKNRGPDQCAPVIRSAITVSER